MAAFRAGVRARRQGERIPDSDEEANRPSMAPAAVAWRWRFFHGGGFFRWGCGCRTCDAECNAFLDAILADALFGWLS